MDKQLALPKPSPITVMQHEFRDLGKPDDCHWILFSSGTFYTFLKSDCKPFDGDELVAKALDMSSRATLADMDESDCVSYIPLREYGHPTFIVLSCLGPRIGWVIVSKSPHWPETEQQEAAVGYLGRTLYELDCKENKIVATSFEWSGNRN